MSDGELWSSLVTAIHPRDTKLSMPIVLQSTIHLLESELAKARAALQEIQPNVVPVCMSSDELAVGAMAAYRQNLIGRAPDFFYGSRRLSPKEVGLVPAVREVSPDDSESEEVQTPPQCSVITSPPKPTSLLDVLGNSLVLDHMAPYLSTPALFALARTCRFLHTAVTETPYVFRHLDVTRCRGTLLPNADDQMDDSISEDEFYSAPLRSIFSKLERKSILQDVRTLVLDGLSVPADLVLDILLKDQFNVNILSIRDCRHLNERKLMQSIQYAVRPSRPKGTPRVKGIYLFTPSQNSQPVVRAKYRDWWGSRCSGQPASSIPAVARGSREGDTLSMDSTKEASAQHAWYSPSGKLLHRAIDEGWAETLQKCQGIIAFDAVLCRGPRHNVDLYSSTDSSDTQPQGRMLGPAIATVALGPIGCENCHASPEGPAVWGESPDEHFPMLTPLPFHSSSVEVAKRPGLFPDANPGLIARCEQCLTDRRCHRCSAWFCASCLPHPERVRTPLTPHQTAVRGPRDITDVAMPQERGGLELGVSKDCWECGPTCAACKQKYERTCQNCQGDYCIEHNDGCSSTMVRIQRNVRLPLWSWSNLT